MFPAEYVVVVALTSTTFLYMFLFVCILCGSLFLAEYVYHGVCELLFDDFRGSSGRNMFRQFDVVYSSRIIAARLLP